MNVDAMNKDIVWCLAARNPLQVKKYSHALLPAFLRKHFPDGNTFMGFPVRYHPSIPPNVFLIMNHENQLLGMLEIPEDPQDVVEI